jgi:hypothetical protein
MNSISLKDYKNLIEQKTPKKRRQIEGKLQMDIGKMLRGVWSYRLNPNLIFWTYSGAGEKKDPRTTGKWQKIKGLAKGDPDYRFEIIRDETLHLVYLETKTTNGSLTKEQKNFFESHKNLANVTCGVAKDMQEVENLLLKTEIFIK